ncbi:MAG: hypothetical protein ABF703_00890 [Oenococcus sp.]|uniref:hypothetical protein n=1 Tax=Oenococcus TaxID=46254 RepID=UPI0021E75E7F|nr:hypothetical protein [Oenococcus kitaharae]MCV3296344.1 hypothetical protein [Oenococcus kitaharae]
MKKITSLCLLIALIFASFLVINIYETRDYITVNNLGQTPSSFQFYISNTNRTARQELAFFRQLADKEKVSIFRTDTKGQNSDVVLKSVVFEKSSFPFQQFHLRPHNLFKNGQSIYTSFKTDSRYQAASIPVFWSANKVQLQTMARYYRQDDKSLNGTYTVSSTQSINKTAVVNKLSQFFAVSPKVLLTSSYGSGTSFINISLMLFVLIIVMTILVLAIVIIYTPLAQIKEIGIKKLNGISNRSIFWDFIKTNICVIILVSMLIDATAWFYFRYRPSGFFVSLLMSQLFILLLFLILNAFVYLTIKQVTISKLLKNFLNFRLGNVLCLIMKGVMMLLVTALLIFIGNNVHALMQQNAFNRSWQKNGRVLTLNQYHESNSEFQDSLLGGHQTSDKLFVLFKKLERSTDAVYINGEMTKPYATGGAQKKENQSLYFARRKFPVMTVNKNYFKHFHNRQLELRKNPSNIRQFIVPASYKKQAAKTKYLCQNLIFSDLSSAEEKRTNLTDIPVQIDYYDDPQLSVFPYRADTKDNFAQPIFQIFDDNNATFFEKIILTNNGINNPIKIQNTAANRSNIKTISHSNFFRPLQLQFVTDNSLLADQASTDTEVINRSSAVTLAVFFLSLVSSIFLLACIIQSKANRLAVERLLGIKLFDRYRTEIISFAASYIIQLAAIMIFGRSMLLLPFVLLLIALDAAISVAFILIREKSSLALTLKGEQS